MTQRFTKVVGTRSRRNLLRMLVILDIITLHCKCASLATFCI